MPAKVEILIQVCVNGRAMWRKAKMVKPELSTFMTDREYDHVLDASVRELSQQVKNFKDAENRKKKETVPA